jgi:hypothetical protein
MNRAVWLKILIVAALSLALAGTPESGFAQRGGGGFHGGGGGFHGGGFGGGSAFHGSGFGGGGFHGGGFGGGVHNGGFGGFHGGNFGGFHGGWGFPGWWGWGGWGWGWGINIGFGWPYWGYPYYNSWWGPYAYGYPYAPYYYPADRDSAPDGRYVPDYRYAPDHRVPDYRHDNSQPDDQSSPAKPSTMELPGSSAEHNYVTRNFDQRPNVSNTGVRGEARATNLQLATSTSPLPSTSRQTVALRPEVQNAIRLLRAMPPAAAQERINSGRYASFSPQEQKLLNLAAQGLQEN